MVIRPPLAGSSPANAAAGTIRKDFADSIEASSVHGSDSPETAAEEIAFFFAGTETPASFTGLARRVPIVEAKTIREWARGVVE
jgi:hypothetical protein